MTKRRQAYPQSYGSAAEVRRIVQLQHPQAKGVRVRRAMPSSTVHGWVAEWTEGR